MPGGDPEPPEDPGPEDPGPENPGTEDPGPGTEDPGPGEDPGWEDPGWEDPGWEDPGYELPDSGSDVPDYNYYPPSSGGTGAASSWAFYDPAEPPAEEVPDPNAAPVAAPVATVPVFTSYDAATRTLTGTAQPGAVVRVADAAGNPVVEDVVAAENGSFAVVLPEGVDLAGLSIFVVNENGEPVGGALAGATIVEELARRELAQVRTAAGASTTELASNLMVSVGNLAVASTVEQPEEEGMPPLPYILGAAAGVVALGAVVGGVIAVRRRSSSRKDDDGEAPSLVQSVVAAPATAIPTAHVAPDAAPAMGSPFSPFVDLDESGSFDAVVSDSGTAAVGGGDDLDDFVPLPAVSLDDDDDDFLSFSASSQTVSYASPARAARGDDDFDDIETLAMNVLNSTAPGMAPIGSSRSARTQNASSVGIGFDPDDDLL